MRFLLHCQTPHSGVEVLKCFPEIKSICRHVAQYYVNLCDVISGHKSTQSAALLQSRECGQNEEAGRHGAEQGELSPRLTTFFCPYAHPFTISLAMSTTYLLGKSCKTKESHESFSSYESFKFSPQISLTASFFGNPHLFPTVILDPQQMKFWVVESGINDFLIYYWLFKFLHLPPLFSLHHCWKNDFCSSFHCCFSERRNHPMTGKEQCKTPDNPQREYSESNAHTGFLWIFFEPSLLLSSHLNI